MMKIEDVKLVYVPDAKSGQQILDQMSGVMKRMEEFEEQIAKWVGNVNNHIVTVDKSLDNIKAQNEASNEKAAEQFETIQAMLVEIRAEQKAHDEWHNKNKSVFSKIFGK